jgi:hypothetical protein
MAQEIFELEQKLCSGKNGSGVELGPNSLSKSTLSVRSIVYISLASTFALALVVLIATFAGIYGYRLSRYVHSVGGLEITPLSNAIQTGDLILFSSHLNEVSSIPTMVVTESPITHVGVVVRNPVSRLLYIVEVTLEGLRMRGCGIANLEARVSMYYGIVLWRKLHSSSDQSKQQEFDEKAFLLAQNAVQKNFGYRYSFLLTMWNRFGPPMTPMAMDFDNSADEDWICTDLVAWILEQLKIFLVAPVTLLPRDFHSITQRLPMNPDYYYGVESRLK